MLLAFGMVAALLEAARSGQGQVVDAAMIDGAASLMTMIHAFPARPLDRASAGSNLLDTGAHFYEVYETADGKWIAVGAHRAAVLRRVARRSRPEGDPSLPAQMHGTTGPP